MKLKPRILLPALLYVFVSITALYGNAFAANSQGTPHRSPSVINISVSLPEGTTLLGLGVGHAATPSFSIFGNYMLTAPELGDAMLHDFSGGMCIGILSTKYGFPVEMSVIGSASFMIASGLPQEVSLSGKGYTVGLSSGRSMLFSNNIRVATAVTSLWTSSSSELSVLGTDVDKQKSSRHLWNINLLLGIRDLVSLAPDLTFAENMRVPGFSVIIRNSVSLRAEVAHTDSKTIPSFSIGFVVK